VNHHATTADSPVKIVDAASRVYAQSLLELAEEVGQLDAIGDELQQLVDLLAAEPQLDAIFRSRSIGTTRRARSIAAIFEGRVSDLTYRFLQVVNANGRLGMLGTIAAAYDQLLKARRGEVDVLVTSARPLDQTQVGAVTQQVSDAIGGKAIVTARVDESIIGGLRLRIGDRLIDGSVATQLRNLKRRMIERGRDYVRSSAAALLEEGSDED
jgi:F-type H+-transporting ATPase subunit delta